MIAPAAPPLQPLPLLAATLAASLVVTWSATPLVKKIARRHNIMDHPDPRKTHRAPTPYLGGVAIFLGLLAGLLLSGAMTGEAFNTDMAAWALAGIGAIHLTGVIDDIKGTNPATKMAGQLVAAAALANLPGARFLALDLWSLFSSAEPPHFAMQMIAAAGSAILVLGATNAMNLIDGLDGLCGSLTAVAQLGFIAIALSILARDPKDGSALLALVLAVATLGACLGYLRWNWFPARLFMGDAGSLMLGYLVAMQAVLLASSAPAGRPGLCLLQSFGAVVVFGVPIADTTLAILRRKLQGQPIMSPDALHLHHLLRRKFTIPATVILLSLCGLACALMGVAIVIGWPSRWGAVGILGTGYAVALVVGYRVATRITPKAGPPPPGA